MKQAELLNRDQSLIIRMIHNYQQVNDYNCSLYVIKNAQAVINYQNQPEIMRNTPQINVFHHLYDTVIQNWGWTEEEIAQLSQKRTVEHSFKLGSSVRSQISLLSEASSGITTLSALNALMRQLNLSNVISP